MTLHGRSAIGPAFLLVALAFNAYVLFPELISRTPPVNDHVFHLLNLQRVADALATGRDPTDVWQPWVGQGYPVFHYYQHLPYLAPAAIGLIGGFDLFGVLRVTNYVLLCLFPASVYWAARRFSFSGLSAGASALVASLLATDALFGFDFASYTWAGHGLYTQLWGMLLLPLALSESYRAITRGGGYFWAVVLVAATALSHLAYGYIALGSMVVFCLLVPKWSEVLHRARRLAIVVGFFALTTSYFFVPLFMDRGFLNRSVWEADVKYDSFGAPTILGWLFSGQLLDFARLPTITVLAGIGLLACAWRWRKEVHYRVPVLLFLLWLLLYFGRPMWGAVLDLVPFGRDFFLHRLIGGVHFAAILLAGIGLAAPLAWALERARAPAVVGTLALTALLLVPVALERADYMQFDKALMERTDVAVAAERADLERLVTTIESLPPGRVYAGLAAQWGKDYTVGDVPVYALLAAEGYDTLRLYHSWSLAGDVAARFDERRPDQYDLFNIRYVVAPAEHVFPDFVRPLAAFGRHQLYEVRTSGYFDLVESRIGFLGDKEGFYPAASAWLDSGQVIAKEHPTVFFGEPPEAPGVPILPIDAAPAHFAGSSGAAQSGLGSITAESESSDRYQASVEVSRPGLVMLKATYHPNWRVLVDGVRATTRMVMPGYVAVPIEPGVHEVVFEYRAGALRTALMGVGVSSMGVLLLLQRRHRGIDRMITTSAAGRSWTRALASITSRVHRMSEERAGPTSEASMPPSGRITWDPDVPQGTREPVKADRLQSTRTVTGQRLVALDLGALAGVLMASLIAGYPLLSGRWLSGHDALVYLPRSVEFYEGLRQGVWFPRWAAHLGFGHGEPIFIFNPPLINYLTSAFHAVGLNFVAAENAALLLLLALAGTGMYFLAREFFGRRGGVASAVAYLFAPYLLSRLYVSHALADFAAFAFLPFAFWGLYRYTDEARYRFLVIGAVATALVMLSSSSVALMTFPALGLVIGWLWFARRRRFDILARGAWCLLLALGLAAFFWVPSLLETSFVHIVRREELAYGDHFASVLQLIHSSWGFGPSQAGTGDGMSFAIGPLYLAAAGAALLLLRRLGRISARARSAVAMFLVIAAGAAFMTASLSRPVWDAIAALHPLQFPFRFLQLVALGTSFLVGSFLVLVRDRTAQANGLMVGLVAASVLLGFPQARPEAYLDLNDADFTPQRIAADGIAASAREFEPIWVEEFPTTPAPEPELTFVSGAGEVTDALSTPLRHLFAVDVARDSLVRSSTFYFPGWTLSVDGVRRAVAPGRPHGLMEFYLEPGRHAVLLEFEDTPIRTASSIASAGALALLLGTVLLRRVRRRKPDRHVMS